MIVYLITNRINGKRYVGQTVVSLKKRLAVHHACVKRESSFYLHRAMRKYGIQNFSINPLVIVGNKQDANLYERGLIHVWGLRNPSKGYNLTDGGEGTLGRVVSRKTREKMRKKLLGRVVSQETRRKMSEGRRGITSWNKGKPFSEESKKKMSLARIGKTSPNKGKKFSREAREKMRLRQLGKRHSIETRQKMSDAHKGHKAWNRSLRVSEEYIRKTGKRGKITNENKGERHAY